MDEIELIRIEPKYRLKGNNNPVNTDSIPIPSPKAIIHFEGECCLINKNFVLALKKFKECSECKEGYVPEFYINYNICYTICYLSELLICENDVKDFFIYYQKCLNSIPEIYKEKIMLLKLKFIYDILKTATNLNINATYDTDYINRNELINMLSQLIQINPCRPSYFRMLGVELMKIKNFNKALKCYFKAIDLLKNQRSSDDWLATVMYLCLCYYFMKKPFEYLSWSGKLKGTRFFLTEETNEMLELYKNRIFCKNLNKW
jgi:tetratricopeptide (TPR) repeat protein